MNLFKIFKIDISFFYNLFFYKLKTIKFLNKKKVEIEKMVLAI